MILNISEVKTNIIKLESVCPELCNHGDDQMTQLLNEGADIDTKYDRDDLTSDMFHCEQILDVEFLGNNYDSCLRYCVPTYRVTYVT